MVYTGCVYFWAGAQADSNPKAVATTLRGSEHAGIYCRMHLLLPICLDRYAQLPQEQRISWLRTKLHDSDCHRSGLIPRFRFIRLLKESKVLNGSSDIELEQILPLLTRGLVPR